MAEAYVYRPITDHTVLKPTGVLLGKFQKDVGFRNLGNYESLTLTIEKEEEEIWTPQTPTRSKIATIYDEVQVNLSFVMQQLADLTRAAVMQAEPKMAFAQLVQTDKPFSFEDVEEGMILPLGFRQLTDIELPAAWVAGTHFSIDAAAGHLEIIKFPNGVPVGDVSGTFSAAAITGRKMWGIASQLDLRGGIMFRGTNPRRNGPKQLAEFWDVGLGGDGDIPLGSNSSDQGSVTMTGKVYSDPTQEEAFQYGRITDLPA